jgi:hypothetical protein
MLITMFGHDDIKQLRTEIAAQRKVPIRLPCFSPRLFFFNPGRANCLYRSLLLISSGPQGRYGKPWWLPSTSPDLSYAGTIPPRLVHAHWLHHRRNRPTSTLPVYLTVVYIRPAHSIRTDELCSCFHRSVVLLTCDTPGHYACAPADVKTCH